jgi:uncharacterized protein
MAGLRVVLDTSVLVSGLAYPASIPGRILSLWRQGGLALVLSRYILDETARVLPRLPRVQLNSGEVRDLVDSFMFLADMVEPAGQGEPALRDSKDQKILGTLLGAQADCLVTGDKDLLVLAGTYPIVTPAMFWVRHG